MALLNWLIMEFTTGFILYVGAGPLVGRLLPPGERHRVADFYFRQAMFAYGRAVIARLSPGYTIAGSEFDDKYGAEQPRIGDGNHRFFDPNGLMSTAYNRPLGFVIPGERGNGLITDARVALAGAEHILEFEAGERKYPVKVGGETRMHWKTWLGVDAVARLVDVDAAKELLNAVGSADSRVGKQIEDYVEKSQSGYRSPNTKQVATIMTAFLFSHGLGWFALTQLGGGGGLGVVDSFNLFVGWWL